MRNRKAQAFSRSMLAVVVSCAAVAPAAHAEINLNGFMTMAAGMTLDDDVTQAGYDNHLSFKPDSLVGLQANSDIGDGLSATTQLVAKGSKDYDVEAEWAYLTYQASPKLRFNVGRQRIPLYMYSDFLDVGYAYQWAKPPRTFYSSPISRFDGVSALYSEYLGSLETTVQIIGGSYSENDFQSGDQAYDIEFEEYMGAVLTLAYEPITFRATYQETQLTLDGGSFDGMKALASMLGGHPIAEKLVIDRSNLTFAAVGIMGDFGNLRLEAEARMQDYGDTVLPEEQAYYLSMGYRLGSFVPYISAERVEGDVDREDQATLINLAGPNGAAIVAAMNAAYSDSNTYTAGVRYDFHPAAALNLEYSRFDDHRDQSLLPPGEGGDSELITVSISAVF